MGSIRQACSAFWGPSTALSNIHIQQDTTHGFKNIYYIHNKRKTQVWQVNRICQSTITVLLNKRNEYLRSSLLEFNEKPDTAHLTSQQTIRKECTYSPPCSHNKLNTYLLIVTCILIFLTMVTIPVCKYTNHRKQ